MLGVLSKRSPWVLRVFLTAVSALSAVCFASAFTLAPSPAATLSQTASPARASSNTYDASALAATSSLHWWHVRHVAHMAHLAWLAQQEAARAWAASHPVRQAPVQAAAVKTYTYSAASGPETYSGSGGMQACIIARESGGNSQVFNASGHYGLYQFSYSTWVGSGGAAADFGRASVAEQNQVFANAVAARGYSDWAPYDGC